MKRSILRFGAIAMATAGLAVGVAAASSASLDSTGPQSHNSVKDTTSTNVDVHSTNNVGVNNGNSQGASTGDAKTKDNTTAGDATTGAASNSNDVSTTVDSSGSCGCTDLSGLLGGGTGGNNDSTISNTGPQSHNTVDISSKTEVHLSTTNNVNVNNNNTQSASSGKAEVSDNTTGGSATSGDASNDNSTTTSLSF